MRRAFGKKYHKDILEKMDVDTMSGTERRKLIVKKAIDAYREPTVAENIAELGDLTSFYALARAKDKMQRHPVGRRILEEQPRVAGSFDMKRYLEPGKFGTLGHAYATFMSNYDLEAESRPVVRYVPDYELAYVMQRYREVRPGLTPRFMTSCTHCLAAEG